MATTDRQLRHHPAPTATGSEAPSSTGGMKGENPSPSGAPGAVARIDLDPGTGRIGGHSGDLRHPRSWLPNGTAERGRRSDQVFSRRELGAPILLQFFSKFSSIEFGPLRCLDEAMETHHRTHEPFCRVAQAVMQERFKEKSRFAPWFRVPQMA